MMISLSKVGKFFGPSTAVRNISLKAGKGEVIGFLGPNGAGKTTTMRLILGYLTPSEGVIEVSGLNPIRNRTSLLKSIGYLPENNPLYSDMKVKEYLAFIGSVKNDVNIEKVRDLVDLKEVWEKKIEVLSRGYKQRVGLAAALLGNPEILILDEPTSGLDPIEQDKIKTLIRKLAKDKTVLFSTHILSEVEAIATRLIIINHGQVVYDGKKPAGRGGVETLFKKVVKS
jgi:ABC-2 type transport system ATP-binding protein